jgi:hypothetical protein
MAEPANSFKQFDYSLRPSKQVERKIMIEVLLRLSKAHYSVSDYKYLGFGSVYYVDFVMFHKYLFIEKMICVEWGEVARRMKFNKPFKFIKLKLGPLSKHIPTIRPSEKFLVWLDYDRALDQDMVQDIDGTVGRLGRGSIFIVTIDARPRLPKDEFDVSGMSQEQRERLTVKIYKEWFGQYVESRINSATIAGFHVAPLFYEVVIERIKQTLTRRERNLRFIQIFHYVYRDGAPMFTVGGIIGTDVDERALQDAGILNHRFVRTSSDYLEISVPPLTLREKQWIDWRLDQNLTADKLSFELDEDLLANYRRFYKEYPTYLETLL